MTKGDIALRKELGDRTYEASVKLLQKDAIQEVVQLSPTAYYAKVREPAPRSSSSAPGRVPSTPPATAPRSPWAASTAPPCT